MDFEWVKLWLSNHAARRIRAEQGKALFGMLMAPLALIVAVFLVFLLAFVIATKVQQPEKPDAGICLLIALASVPLMFLGNRFSPQKSWEESCGDTGDFISNYFRRRKMIWYIFQWFLYTGPRLVSWSGSCRRHAAGWKTMNDHDTAAVIWVLLNAGKRVSHEEIVLQLDWIDLEKTLLEVKMVAGVLPLQGPPQGLSLTTDFRASLLKEIRQLRANTAESTS